MLNDLKSFFTNSNVVEVGVGVTIGVAFAGLVGAATESGQSLLSGDFEYDGLVRAAIVLLSVAVLSVVGVITPLMRLKERMSRVQADKVSEAVQNARSGDLRGATSAPTGAATATDGAADGVADGTANSNGVADLAGAEAGDRSASGAGAESAPFAVGSADHGLSAADGQTGLSQPTLDGSAIPDGAAGDGALTAGPNATGQSAGNADPAASDAPDGRHAVAAAAVPHAALATKTCPFCAFEIPEVATRCGWCTSDLGDLERADVPVRVDA